MKKRGGSLFWGSISVSHKDAKDTKLFIDFLSDLSGFVGKFFQIERLFVLVRACMQRRIE